MLCVDQEGGRVARLKGDTGSGVFTNVLAMRAVGRAEEAGMAGAARAAGRVLGAEVRWAGFDVNFSPVVDVDTNPANPVIGSRSFSREASVVGRLGAQLIRAMQEESGVAACAKHFPGHGDTSLDSHKALPALPHGMERLEAAELPPFRAAVEAGVAGVMSAHVLFEAVDRQYPATMSHAALGAIVRGKMGFGGVIFSDDLEMKAMADHYALEEQLVRGVSAGVDLFLICHTPELQWKAVEILAREIEAGRMPGVMESRARVEKMARRYWRPVKGGESLANVQGRLRAERELLQRVTEKYGVMGEGDPTRFM
jgi:beta-N-acetylhexosaminidase